jgi:hypothetical protein
MDFEFGHLSHTFEERLIKYLYLNGLTDIDVPFVCFLGAFVFPHSTISVENSIFPASSSRESSSAFTVSLVITVPC